MPMNLLCTILWGELGDYKEAGLIIEEGLKMHPGSSELMLQYAKN